MGALPITMWRVTPSLIPEYVFLCCSLVICGALPKSSAATFLGLGDLPGGPFYSAPKGMTSDGKIVVGLSQSAAGYESFIWTATEGMRPLAFPAGKSVTGISGDGRVLLGWDRLASQSFVGSEQSVFVLFGDLPGGENYSSAHSISWNGKVAVGRGSSQNGTEGFVWTADTGITGLGDFPGGKFFSEAYAVSADASVIVGVSDVESGTEAFRWTATEGLVSLGDFPGGYTNGIAQGVSADGKVIVGRAYPGTFDYATHEAFLWTAQAGMVHLGFAGDDQDSLAYACSADGNTVVGDEPFRDSGYALLWQPGQGMRHLVDVLTELGADLSGWKLISARLISYDGTVIVGSGINPAGDSEAWIATIPAFVPHLSLHLPSTDTVALSWPSPSSGYVLQSTDRLSQNISWQPVTVPVSDDGTNRTVTLKQAVSSQYFRLVKP